MVRQILIVFLFLLPLHAQTPVGVELIKDKSLEESYQLYLNAPKYWHHRGYVSDIEEFLGPFQYGSPCLYTYTMEKTANGGYLLIAYDGDSTGDFTDIAIGKGIARISFYYRITTATVLQLREMNGTTIFASINLVADNTWRKYDSSIYFSNGINLQISSGWDTNIYDFISLGEISVVIEKSTQPSATTNTIFAPIMAYKLLRDEEWTPKTLGSSVLFWLDASQGVTLNDTLVSAWADQSGNGWHVTQSTASNQPIYRPTIANGKPAIEFGYADASTYMLGSTSYPAIQTKVVFIVCYLTSASGSPSTHQYPTIISKGYSVDSSYAFGFQQSNAKPQMWFDGKSYKPYALTDVGTGAWMELENYVYSTYQFYKNGTFLTDTVLGTGVTGSNGKNLAIGYNNQDGSYFFRGYVAEILIVNKVMTSTEISLVRGYFRQKYGGIL